MKNSPQGKREKQEVEMGVESGEGWQAIGKYECWEWLMLISQMN
jgi:hypothetical protein